MHWMTNPPSIESNRMHDPTGLPQLDETTLSDAEKKSLQTFRDNYKLDDLLDFQGNKGREVWDGNEGREDTEAMNAWKYTSMTD